MLSFLYLKDWEKHFLDAGASKPSDWNSELDGDWLQKPPYQVCGFFLQWLWTLVVVLASVPTCAVRKEYSCVIGSKSNLASQLLFVKRTHRDPSLLASTWAGSSFSFYSNTGGVSQGNLIIQSFEVGYFWKTLCKGNEGKVEGIPRIRGRVLLIKKSF